MGANRSLQEKFLKCGACDGVPMEGTWQHNLLEGISLGSAVERKGLQHDSVRIASHAVTCSWRGDDSTACTSGTACTGTTHAHVPHPKHLLDCSGGAPEESVAAAVLQRLCSGAATKVVIPCFTGLRIPVAWSTACAGRASRSGNHDIE